MSDTDFAISTQQKITPALKLLIVQPALVARGGIRALQTGRISVVLGWAYKATVMFTGQRLAGCTKPFSLAS